MPETPDKTLRSSVLVTCDVARRSVSTEAECGVQDAKESGTGPAAPMSRILTENTSYRRSNGGSCALAVRFTHCFVFLDRR